jgi:hypothetical protein
MKFIKSKNREKLTGCYIYADGHAVLTFEESHPQAGTVNWVELVEKFGPHCSFEGRITIGRYQLALIELIQKANTIRAKAISTEHGSDRTKALGLGIGSLEVIMDEGWRNSLYFHEFSHMAGPYHYQPDMKETWAECLENDNCPGYDPSFWGSYRIAAIHRATKETKTA